MDIGGWNLMMEIRPGYHTKMYTKEYLCGEVVLITTGKTLRQVPVLTKLFKIVSTNLKKCLILKSKCTKSCISEYCKKGYIEQKGISWAAGRCLSGR